MHRVAQNDVTKKNSQPSVPSPTGFTKLDYFFFALRLMSFSSSVGGVGSFAVVLVLAPGQKKKKRGGLLLVLCALYLSTVPLSPWPLPSLLVLPSKWEDIKRAQ